MPIERLAETNRPRHVVDQVLASIQDGSLKVGEWLPSEAKLAELTGWGGRRCAKHWRRCRPLQTRQNLRRCDKMQLVC